jgi:hypothetical protein
VAGTFLNGSAGDAEVHSPADYDPHDGFPMTPPAAFWRFTAEMRQDTGYALWIESFLA